MPSSLLLSMYGGVRGRKSIFIPGLGMVLVGGGGGGG